MDHTKPIRRKLPPNPPPTSELEESSEGVFDGKSDSEASTTSKNILTQSSQCSSESESTQQSDTVPRTEFDTLQQKYEEVCRELSQKKSYIVGLEKLLDIERQKVNELIQGTRKKKGHMRRHSSKNFNAIFSLKDKEKEKEKELQIDQIKQTKEQYQLEIQQLNDERKKQMESRVAHLEDKKKAHRMQVLGEILNTERDYIETLRIIILCQSSLRNHNVLFEEELGFIFSNVEEIYSLHKSTCEALASCFECAGEENCWNISVGEILLQLADSLPVYTVYINNEALQSPTVRACARRKDFVNVLYNEIPKFTDRTLLVSSLRSCLIAPIQRLCKYPLLVRELLSVTDETHNDIRSLKEALNKLQEAAMNVNEEKKAAEQQAKLKAIEETIIDTKGFELRREGRIFVMEGSLLKTSNGRTQERHFYLFNDVLIYGRTSMMKAGRVHMKGKILLGRLVIQNLEESSPVKHGFEIVRLDHKKKRYIIASKFSGSKGEANLKLWRNAIEQQAMIQRLNFEENPPETEEEWHPYGITGNDILKKTFTLTRSPFRKQ